MATLYRLDYREPIQWPFEKRREEGRAKAKSKTVDIILVRLP